MKLQRSVVMFATILCAALSARALAQESCNAFLQRGIYEKIQAQDASVSYSQVLGEICAQYNRLQSDKESGSVQADYAIAAGGVLFTAEQLDAVGQIMCKPDSSEGISHATYEKAKEFISSEAISAWLECLGLHRGEPQVKTESRAEVSAAIAASLDPTGTIVFYEGFNFTGRSFHIFFHALPHQSSLKWDQYDFEQLVGNNTISSFRAYVSQPTTLYLFEHNHFRGRFVDFHLAANQWTNVANISSRGFNDMTSSIAVTNPGNGGLFVDTPVPFLDAVKEFREALETTLKTAVGKDHIPRMHDTEVMWDTKLNLLTRQRCYRDYDERRVFNLYLSGQRMISDDGDLYALFTPSFSFLKNDDLLLFHQYLTLDLDGRLGYDLHFRFWIKPIIDNGAIKFQPYAWEYWIEDGWYGYKGQVEQSLRPQMTPALIKLAQTVDEKVRGALGSLATNVERVSFTLRSDNRNPFTRAAASTVEATPPSIIVRHKQ